MNQRSNRSQIKTNPKFNSKENEAKKKEIRTDTHTRSVPNIEHSVEAYNQNRSDIKISMKVRLYA